MSLWWDFHTFLMTNISTDEFVEFAESFTVPRFWVNENSGVFKMHRYLVRLYELCETQQRVVGTKFRQGGFSTFHCIYSLWKMHTQNHCNVYFHCNRDRDRDKIQLLIENLIGSLKPIKAEKYNSLDSDWCVDDSGRVELSKSLGYRYGDYRFCFSNYNNIYLNPTRGVPVTASAINIFDEVSHWDDSWGLSAQNLKKFIAISTPGEKSGWFYEEWKTKNYKATVEEHPIMGDNIWMGHTKENLTEKTFREEYMGEFV